MDSKILFAGHGGQGILFAAKVATYAGLYDDMHVSWMPSYGPEMRGGTANCGVSISKKPIGSPIVNSPGILVAMNAPAYEKFIGAVTPGGRVFVDATLVRQACPRDDVEQTEMPATRLAAENGLEGLASVLLLGLVVKETGFASLASVEKALAACVPEKKPHLLAPNIRALHLGAGN